MSNENKVKVDTAALLANLKNKANPEGSAPVVETVVETDPVVVPTAAAPVVIPTPVVDQYQQYTASRASTCLITPTGKRINFTNYQYYTKDPEIVAYLDREIASGLRGFTKGKVLTAEELNPEAALKRKIIDEFKDSQEGREFGNTKAVEDRTTALSSGQVAN